MMDKKDKSQKYFTNCIGRFGVVALLVYIEELEKIEDYEKCQLVVDSIKRHNHLYSHDLPTKLEKNLLISIQGKLNLPSVEYTYNYYKEFSKTISAEINKILS